MTLEQCKKLKDWGLSQIVKSGTSYWNKHIGRPQWLAAGIADWEIDNEHSFAIPDLEQLLEFARKKLTFINLWASPPNDEWGVYALQKGEKVNAYDPDPKVAVYKLLEKIMSPAVLSPTKE